MSIKVRCPACKKVLAVDDASAGKQARCPGCKEVFPIRATAADEESARGPRSSITARKSEASTSGRGGRDTSEDDFSLGGERPRRSRAGDDRNEEEGESLAAVLAGEQGRMPRAGVLFSQIAMAGYLGFWAVFLLAVLLNGAIVLGGGSDPDLLKLLQVAATVLLLLFLLTQLLSLIGAGLTLTTPARGGVKPMAILSFSCCLSVLIAFVALYLDGRLAISSGAKPDSAEVLIGFTVLLEASRALFLALYMGGVAKQVRDEVLRGRAVLLYFLTPSFTAGSVVLVLIARAAATSAGAGQGEMIVTLLLFALCAVGYFVLSLFFFRALRETRSVMAGVEREPTRSGDRRRERYEEVEEDEPQADRPRRAGAHRRARGLLMAGLALHCFAAVASLGCLVMLFLTHFTAAAWFALAAAALEVPNFVLCLAASPAGSWVTLLLSLALRAGSVLSAAVYLMTLTEANRKEPILPILMGATIVVSWGVWIGFLMGRLESVGATELKSDLGKAVKSGISTVILQAVILGIIALASKGDASFMVPIKVFSIIGTLFYGVFTIFLYQTTDQPLWKCALYPTAIPFLLDYLTLVMGLRVELSRGPRVNPVG